MRRKARKRRMRNEMRNLPADKKNSGENGDNPRPLPARHMFLEEDGRKTDGDRSVQGAKDGDDRDLFHFHSEIAEDKGTGIQGPHTQGHPAHLAAWKPHGLLGNEDHRRGEHGTGQTDHPHGLNGPDARNDANSEQPKQHREAKGREDGPADSTAAPAHGLSIVLVRCFFSAGNNHDAYQRADDSGNSHNAQPLAGHPGKQQSQRGITGRERSHYGYFPNLKRTVERQSRHGIEAPSQETPSPGLPSGTIREMPPTAESGKKKREQKKTRQLHVQHGTQSANAMRGKTRNKIRAAPGQRRQQAQQNSHDELGGLAFLHFEAEHGHDFLEIFPDFAFRGGVAQQIGRVIGRQQFSSAKFQPLAAKLGNSAIGLQQCFCGDGAQANNHFRSNAVDLPQEKWRAGAHFVFFRLAILRRPAFHYVADIHIFALQSHRFDHLRKQFSRAPDERQTLRIFIGARAFAHKNQLGLGISVAENNFVSRAVELTARAFAKVLANLEQRIVRNLVHGFEKRRSRNDRQGCDLWTHRRNLL